MVRENPSIPWCSTCGTMMVVLAKWEGKPWFECMHCGEIITYKEGQNRVKKQKENWIMKKTKKIYAQCEKCGKFAELKYVDQNLRLWYLCKKCCGKK